MIQINNWLSVDEKEIIETFQRASGPGGQNVNKVSSAVQLRFDVDQSPNLPPDVAERLKKLGGRRMTNDGVLVLNAQRFRTQERNRADALERLIELIREACIRPVLRRATRPSLGSQRRRLDEKKIRSNVKSLRQKAPERD
jgi:ribosome-associated protein